MKKTIIAFSLILLIGYANAQETSQKKPLFKATSFSTSMGFTGRITSNTSEEYYGLKGAVVNPDIFVDITGFTSSSNVYYSNGYGSFGAYSGSGNGSVVFNLGLTPYCKKLGKYRENRELRISVGGNFGTANTFNFYDNNSFVIDTFLSATGNNTVVLADSNINRNLTYTLNFSDINFGLSYLFKTDVQRRLYLYTGVGINYGIAINSSVTVFEETYRSVSYYNQYNRPDENEYWDYDSNNGSFSSSSTSTNLKGSMQFVRAYLPFGLNLRLSNNPKSFFNHANLYTELNPGVEIKMISFDKASVNPYMGVAFIGFSYRW